MLNREHRESQGVEVDAEQTGSWRRYVWPMIVILVAGGIYALTRTGGRAELLTLDRLRQYREKWQRAGVRSYELVATVSGAQRGEYRIRVVDGEIMSATFDGKPLDKSRAAYWTVPGLFGMLERELRNASGRGTWPAGVSVQIYGSFDRETGRPIWWQRVVSGGRGTVTVQIVEFRPLVGEGETRDSSRDTADR